MQQRPSGDKSPVAPSGHALIMAAAAAAAAAVSAAKAVEKLPGNDYILKIMLKSRIVEEGVVGRLLSEVIKASNVTQPY